MFYSKTTEKESNNSNPSPLGSDEIKELLRPITDPDIGISIIELGLIYKIDNNNGDVNIEMTFTTPACPYGPQIMEEIRYTLNAHESVSSVNIDIVWDPPWSMDSMSEETKLELGLDL